MATRKSQNLYYYAGGKRVALEPATDLVAVDEARLAEKVPDLLASDALPSGTRMRGIRLISRHNLDADTLDRLQRAGVTQPVFRQGDATLVALPEIRIEDDREETLAKVRQFVADKAQPITDDAEGRLTLRPLSDDGRDALTLANELVEHYKLASGSPRFLRIVPGPVVPA
jgi:hypothetical protein